MKHSRAGQKNPKQTSTEAIVDTDHTEQSPSDSFFTDELPLVVILVRVKFNNFLHIGYQIIARLNFSDFYQLYYKLYQIQVGCIFFPIYNYSESKI